MNLLSTEAPTTSRLSFADILKMSRGDLILGVSAKPEYKIYKVDVIRTLNPETIKIIVLNDPVNKICFGEHKQKKTKTGVNVITLPQGFDLFDMNLSNCIKQHMAGHLPGGRGMFGFLNLVLPKDRIIGMFLGNVLRDSEYRTRINVLTFDGLNIWIECQ